jgi:NAD(P)-dependent dehydrogenase (short-subunit alcohol dehydrogenase family)
VITSSRRVAIVTGADGGIGTAIVETLERDGFEVVAATLNEGEWQADVASEQDCVDLISRVAARYSRIDVLVNNAATMELHPIDKHDPVGWWRILEVNLSGPFFLSKAAAPHLRQSRGCILNMSSRIAIAGGANASAYAASKAGLLGLTKSLALELAPHVRVNAVAPGAVDTSQLRFDAADVGLTLDAYRTEIAERTPTSRLAEPIDVAETIAFLVSPKARQYTGQVFHLNGGTLMA